MGLDFMKSLPSCQREKTFDILDFLVYKTKGISGTQDKGLFSGMQRKQARKQIQASQARENFADFGHG